MQIGTMYNTSVHTRGIYGIFVEKLHGERRICMDVLGNKDCGCCL